MEVQLLLKVIKCLFVHKGETCSACSYSKLVSSSTLFNRTFSWNGIGMELQHSEKGFFSALLWLLLLLSIVNDVFMFSEMTMKLIRKKQNRSDKFPTFTSSTDIFIIPVILQITLTAPHFFPKQELHSTITKRYCVEPVYLNKTKKRTNEKKHFTDKIPLKMLHFIKHLQYIDTILYFNPP